MSVNIPIVILTFRNQDSTSVLYRAYSPDQWFSPSSQGDQEDVLDGYMTAFKDRIWNKLNYNPNGTSSESSIGRILEIHTRYVSTELSSRHDMAHFFVADNEHTDYKVVKSSLPLFFDLTEAEEYDSANSPDATLAHANHDFI